MTILFNYMDWIGFNLKEYYFFHNSFNFNEKIN